MGTDNLYQKRLETHRKQLRNVRKERAETWLIVCEGEKTEPNYFRSIEAYLQKTFGSKLKLKFRVEGDGRNTKSLIRSVEPFFDYTDTLKRSNKIPYARTFTVFDRDSFAPHAFDNAIFMSHNKEYVPLWSNECFELWYILHFDYLKGRNDRNYYFDRLNDIFKDKYGCKYEKNQSNVFDFIQPNWAEAYSNANKLCKYHEDNTSPAACLPCTTVHKFFEILDEEIERQTGEKHFLLK